MIRNIQETLSRIAAVFHHRTLDQDFEDEFAAHIDLLTEQNARRGLPRDEARRQAILQMGGLNATKQLQREARGLPPVERFLDALRGFWRDLVYAGRSLAKARAFTFVCVVSLGIGMATVIAIPYGGQIVARIAPPGVNTEGLVELVMTQRGPREPSDEWSYPDFADLRDADTGMAITGWAVGQSETAIRTGSGVPTETVSTMFVSANYFSTVGVRLARGPGFDAAVDTRLTPPESVVAVVIVGYDFWQNRLSSDPDIIGKTLTLDGIPHVVVGVAPDQFRGHLMIGAGRLFVPLEQHPRLRTDDSLRFNRDIEWVQIHGRLLPGVSIEQANAAVSAVTSRLAEQYPATNEFKAGSVEAYEFMGKEERSELLGIQFVLLALTGMVLLVVCLNISGMMQVRSAMRERELSIRQALGASRGRLVRYLLSEAIILSGLGGALCALLLFNIPTVLAWWAGLPIPVYLQKALRPDLFMVAICVGLCLATSLVFGLLPAIRFSRPVIISALKDDAGGGGRRVGRVHRLTAALQVGIAVPLLVISGMLVERVRATATADLGFESEGLFATQVKLDARRDESAGFRIRNLRDNLEQASGVASVTVADGLPLDFSYRLTRVTRPTDGTDAEESVFGHVTRVDERYLDTMDIPLLRGRGVTVEDRAGAELVAVISKTLADRLFPNVEARVIGERLTFALEENKLQSFTIVGVTADFVTSQMSTEREQLLVPLAQHPVSSVFLVARSVAGEQPLKLTAAFKNALRDLDPDFNAASVVTGDDLRRRSMQDFLKQSAPAGGSGGIVLALAALGIYGVIGLMVATRTREIAVRIALGASRRRVLGMIMVDVVKLVIPGVAFGLLVTIAVVRMGAEDLGLPVSGLESLAYVFGAAIAILVSLLASLAPARRASSVEPMAAMRSE